MTQKTNMGWECPKCSRIYSPFVEECKNCIPKKQEYPSSSITSTSTTLSHVFIRDDRNTGNICRICGLQEWQHVPFTFTTK